jgi:hypothetical protein
VTFPNFPEEIGPIINLDTENVALLLLAAIAFEELGLAHMINAEAEKIQAAIGTLVDSDGIPIFDPPLAQDLDDLLATNRSVERVLRTIVKKEMILQFKLEDIIDFLQPTTTAAPTITAAPTTTPTPI